MNPEQLTSNDKSECHNAKTEWVPYRYGGHILVCMACLSACYTKPARETALTALEEMDEVADRILGTPAPEKSASAGFMYVHKPDCAINKNQGKGDCTCVPAMPEKAAQDNGTSGSASDKFWRGAKEILENPPSKPLSPMDEWFESNAMGSGKLIVTDSDGKNPQRTYKENGVRELVARTVHEAYERGKDEMSTFWAIKCLKESEAARAEGFKEGYEQCKHEQGTQS